jgi:hypothetical protein
MIKAKYTIVLKTLLDDERTNEQIKKAMSSYPIYQATNEYTYGLIPEREELNKKILNHYKYREIGFETIGRFLDELEISLNEIMPYYNQLYMTTDLDYEILFNVNYTKEIDITREGKQESSASSTSNGENTVTSSDSTTGESYNKSTDSDTPQSQLNIINKDINSIDYASSVQFGHGSTETSGNSQSSSTSDVDSTSTGLTTNDDTEKSVEITKGNYGQVSYQSLIRQYRELITNVTMKIIEDREIASLFMLIY